MSKAKESIFSQRNLTTAGFLVIIGGAVVVFPKVAGPVMSSAIAAYGSGIAFASAFYRLRELMKDGRRSENKLGDGAFAALAVAASIGALNASTYILESVKIATDRSESQLVILGVGLAITGFFQARSTMLKDIKEGAPEEIELDLKVEKAKEQAANAEDKKILNKRNLTTAGFLAIIGSAVVLFPKAPGALMSSAIATYGSGIAFATAFYRLRELMKDGTTTKNKFGDGAFAALGVVAGIGALTASPYILESVKSATNGSDAQLITLGIAIAVAGYFQARSTLLKDINEEGVERSR